MTHSDPATKSAPTESEAGTPSEPGEDDSPGQSSAATVDTSRHADNAHAPAYTPNGKTQNGHAQRAVFDVGQSRGIGEIPGEPVRQSGSWLGWLLGRSRNGAGIRSDLSDALAQPAAESDDFTPEERLMLHNILRLQDVRVEDLMVPRAEIEAVDLETSLGELLTVFEKSGHSRMPVYHETLDDPRGMVHIRDVVAYITRASADGRRKGKDAASRLTLSKVDLARKISKLNLVRTVLFVPPSMPAADLLARMQAGRVQMALVIDEYGGTEGLVSLEDIVELVVGDIEDEHDDDEILIAGAEHGGLLCDARAEIEDIREALGGKLDVGDHEEDAETLGGLIFSILGRVPVKGEIVEAFGYEFHIRDADPRRIRSVEMVPAKKKRTV